MICCRDAVFSLEPRGAGLRLAVLDGVGVSGAIATGVIVRGCRSPTRSPLLSL